MKTDIIRIALRIIFLGFVIGKIKKIKSNRLLDQKNGQKRGFVEPFFPLPGRKFQTGNDFLWEPKESSMLQSEVKKGDRVVFFGYRTKTGWKAKWVLKIL